MQVSGKVFLTGMMGAGKSTTGRSLARTLDCTFYDTDLLIEQEYGPIPEIFSTHGESFFRKVESDALLSVLDVPNAIIATGGGLPCFGDNAARMRNAGKVIYLQCDIQTLVSRLQDHTKARPLLSSRQIGKKLSEILAQRSGCYEMADFTVDGSKPTEEVVSSVLHLLHGNDL